MLAVFNIVVIALVVLIAYWWANQGLFSALLHLLCVIMAGAISLAIWEPLVTRLLLRGGFFDDYAWGTSLVGVFVITLVILRVTFDKLVPGNVELPRAADLGLGFPVGAAAGVLTMGIVVIGAGFVQSTRDLMGFRGMVRVPGGRPAVDNKLWLPVHQWTADFYSYVSAGSLYPTFNNTPLRQLNPDLHYQAASLVRDSALNGRAKLSLKPSEAVIEEFLFDAANRRYLLKVRFNSGARDGGEQLTLSASQIRLIGEASGFNKPKYVFPDLWTQYDGLHRFDDLSHYITTQPGQSQATVVMEFPGQDFTRAPKYVQIRNTRYRLPLPRESATTATRVPEATQGPRVTIDTSEKSIQEAVIQTNSIQPIQASTNQKPPGIRVDEDRFIIGGDGEFMTSGGERPSRQLMIQGIYEPVGTRIIQVDVSRESPANIFGDVRDFAGANSRIMLVDSLGRYYEPIGFLHSKPDNKTMIKVNFQSSFATIEQIPPLPTAGGQPLKLLFNVTEGAVIVGLKVGEITVGTCNLVVRDPKATP